MPVSQLGDFVFNSPLSGIFLDPTTRSSYTQSWNLTVEQQVASDVTLSVSYIGNHSSKIVWIIDLNPAIFGPGATRGNTNARRLYPGFSRLRWFSGFNDANYHGGRIEIEKRSSMGLSVFAHYTHAKSIDLESSGRIGIVEVRQPINRALNRGPSDFDQTHRANVSFLYELPQATSSGGAAAHLLNDWQVNGIITLRSGPPFSIGSGVDNSLSAAGRDYADVIGDPARPAGADKIDQFFNTQAFVPNALGTFGNAGRNLLRGPGSASVDFSVFKDVKLSEGVCWQFRFEPFNFFDRVNFLPPGSGGLRGTVDTLTSPNFGRLTSAHDARVSQSGRKILFSLAPAEDGDWCNEDGTNLDREWRGRIECVKKLAESAPGVDGVIEVPEDDNRHPTLTASWDHGAFGLTVAECAVQLREGPPRIEVLTNHNPSLVAAAGKEGLDASSEAIDRLRIVSAALQPAGRRAADRQAETRGAAARHALRRKQELSGPLLAGDQFRGR